jgi:hypothetical protein
MPGCCDQLKLEGEGADDVRMTNSEPPPTPERPSAPQPTPRQPNYRRRLALASASAAAIVVVFATIALGSSSSDDCVVNGFGSELCGDSARAYCDLLDSNGRLAVTSTDDPDWHTYETCVKVGWNDPSATGE